MTISAEDAEQALNDVAMTERMTQQYTALKGAELISYLWGAIWVIGFVVQHVLSRRGTVLHLGKATISASGMFWWPLIVIGMVGGRTDHVAQRGRQIGAGPRIGKGDRVHVVRPVRVCGVLDCTGQRGR